MLGSWKQLIQKLSLVEMRMLRWISDNTLKVRMKNDYQRDKLEVALLKDKMRHTVSDGLAMYKGDA